MGVRTYIKAEVPDGREAEAFGYLAELAPGEHPADTKRHASSVTHWEVTRPGDVCDQIESQIAAMDTNGIRISVRVGGSDTAAPH
jgi:hypothetical protein